MNKPTHFFYGRGGRLYHFFVLCFFSITIPVHAQKESPPGAKANAMAGAVTATTDPDHTLHAIANSAYATKLQGTTFYKNHYFLPQLHTTAVSILIPWKKITLSSFAQRFGPRHYKEIRAGIGIAHCIKHTALGFRLNWEQLAIEGFNTNHTLAIELGGITTLTEHLKFGANVYNVSLSRLSNQLLPVVMKCGLTATPDDKTTLSVEVEKASHDRLSVKWGAQYHMAAAVTLLIGYRHPASTLHAGMYLSHRSIHIGYSASWSFRLGLSQEFSLALDIKK